MSRRYGRRNQEPQSRGIPGTYEPGYYYQMEDTGECYLVDEYGNLNAVPTTEFWDAQLHNMNAEDGLYGYGDQDDLYGYGNQTGLYGQASSGLYGAEAPHDDSCNCATCQAQAGQSIAATYGTGRQSMNINQYGYHGGLFGRNLGAVMGGGRVPYIPGEEAQDPWTPILGFERTNQGHERRCGCTECIEMNYLSRNYDLGGYLPNGALQQGGARGIGSGGRGRMGRRLRGLFGQGESNNPFGLSGRWD